MRHNFQHHLFVLVFSLLFLPTCSSAWGYGDFDGSFSSPAEGAAVDGGEQITFTFTVSDLWNDGGVDVDLDPVSCSFELVDASKDFVMDIHTDFEPNDDLTKMIFNESAAIPDNYPHVTGEEEYMIKATIIGLDGDALPHLHTVYVTVNISN